MGGFKREPLQLSTQRAGVRAGLDPRVRAFNERRLDGDYPFVMVDGLFIKSRAEDSTATAR